MAKMLLKSQFHLHYYCNVNRRENEWRKKMIGSKRKKTKYQFEIKLLFTSHF